MVVLSVGFPLEVTGAIFAGNSLVFSKTGIIALIFARIDFRATDLSKISYILIFPQQK